MFAFSKHNNITFQNLSLKYTTKSIFLYCTTFLLICNAIIAGILLSNFSEQINISMFKEKEINFLMIFKYFFGLKFSIWDFIYLGLSQVNIIVYGGLNSRQSAFLFISQIAKILSSNSIKSELQNAQVSLQTIICCQSWLLFWYNNRDDEPTPSFMNTNPDDDTLLKDVLIK